MKNRTTKAGQLLKVAYATYRSGEVEIAKDIFVLAMEDPSAPSELGADDVSPEELTKGIQEDVAKGDFDSAKEKMAQLETLKGGAGDLPPAGDPGVPTAEDEPPSEGALSPGDEVPPPPPPELAPAQVASLVTLARKVKASGHPDLSRKITQALGL
jgi:hypothetical protein